MDLKETIQDMIRKTEEFKIILAEKMNDMPDNPKITKLSENCFTIKSSDLFKSDNWTPEYHDPLHQAKIIQELISNSDTLQSMANSLQYIIDTGRTKFQKYQYVRFSPEVREFVKQLL